MYYTHIQSQYFRSKQSWPSARTSRLTVSTPPSASSQNVLELGITFLLETSSGRPADLSSNLSRRAWEGFHFEGSQVTPFTPLRGEKPRPQGGAQAEPPALLRLRASSQPRVRAAHVPGSPSPALDSTSPPLAPQRQSPGPAPPPEPMAGTRWVLGALLRGCGCNCSSCRRTGAACLPFYSAAGTFPSGVSGRRRLLLLLGAAAAAASQTRGLQLGPAAAGRLAGPVPVRPSAAAAAAASYSALRAPLLPRSLAAAAGPARGYCQVRGSARGTLGGRAPASFCRRAPRVRARGSAARTAPPPPSRSVLLLGTGTRDALRAPALLLVLFPPSLGGWSV